MPVHLFSEKTNLAWRYQQKGVDKEDFIVFLTRVILKSPSASEPFCRKTKIKYKKSKIATMCYWASVTTTIFLSVDGGVILTYSNNQRS